MSSNKKLKWKELSLGRKINSIYVDAVTLAIGLVWFALCVSITMIFISLLFNPVDSFNYFISAYSISPAPLWANLIITFLFIYCILPTNTFMKSYYAALGDVILFIFRKKKFKEVMYHFDIRRW
tara:strand:+ start:152 stop:523 length:372 start_codon:yes stop_codon:yes gene_type:complete